MNMKNVIVTGGNGFIGSSLIKKLVANGIKVVAVDITFQGERLPESELRSEERRVGKECRLYCCCRGGAGE